MKENHKPSIRYCCKSVINFSIFLIEKLVCKLECRNSRIIVFSRRISIYD